MSWHFLLVSWHFLLVSGTSYFVHVDISDVDYRCSLFCGRSFVIVGECFLSALMYTAVVLYHGDDYYEMVFRKDLLIILELGIKTITRA